MTKTSDQQLIGQYAEYRLLKRLGGGGVGKTFEAEVVRVFRGPQKGPKGLARGRRVVVKMPRMDRSRDFMYNKKFLKRVCNSLSDEFSTLQRLKNVGGVAHVLDIGSYLLKVRRQQLDAKFLVQELVEGKRFDRYLRQTFGSNTGVFRGISDPSHFFSLTQRLVRVMRLVHQHGVIHGDIWPRNIMMRDGKPVFIDFGEAVFRDCHYPLGRSERHRKNPYCAPERRRAEREGRRSDVYSLGGVLFYMASGQKPPPCNRDDDVLKDRVVSGIQRRNRGLLKRNCGIADIIARCLRYKKDHRTANADALLCEVRTFSFVLARESGRAGVNPPLNRIKRAAVRLKSAGANFLTSVVELELTLAASSVEDMSHGILDLTGDHETLISSLCRYLSVLTRGDLLLIRSEPNLWASHNLGIKGRFLSMIRLLGERGVAIQHIFLTCENDRRNPANERIFRAHQEVLNALRQDKRKPAMEVCYRTVSRDERDQMFRDNWQGAIIIRGRKTTVFEPICDPEGRMRTVRFFSQAPSALRCKKDIVYEMKSAKPIGDWFAS